MLHLNQGDEGFPKERQSRHRVWELEQMRRGASTEWEWGSNLEWRSRRCTEKEEHWPEVAEKRDHKKLWPQIFKGPENLRTEAVVSRVIWYG